MESIDLREILSHSVFKALNISTRWEEIKYFHLDQKGASDKHHSFENQEAFERAKKQKFDNIVIFRSGSPYGFAKTDNIAQDLSIEDSKIRKISDYKIVYDASYLKALDHIVKGDKPSDHALYFIYKDAQRPEGIITYADFNKKSVYLYCYALLSSVELWAKRAIVNYYVDTEQWLALLEPRDRKRIMKHSQTSEEKPIDCVGFPDIYKIITNSPNLCSSSINEGLTCPILTSLLRIRDRIAHPVKLLLYRSNYSTLSKDLLNVLRLSELEPILSGNEKNR